MRTKRSRRRHATQRVISKRQKLMKQFFPDWEERPDGHKLSKFSMACDCAACTCARYYGKREKRELEERICNDRYCDGISELMEESKILLI